MQSFFIRSSLKSLSVLLASLQALTLHRHSLGTFVTRRLEHDVPPKMASIVLARGRSQLCTGVAQSQWIQPDSGYLWMNNSEARFRPYRWSWTRKNCKSMFGIQEVLQDSGEVSLAGKSRQRSRVFHCFASLAAPVHRPRSRPCGGFWSLGFLGILGVLGVLGAWQATCHGATPSFPYAVQDERWCQLGSIGVEWCRWCMFLRKAIAATIPARIWQPYIVCSLSWHWSPGALEIFLIEGRQLSLNLLHFLAWLTYFSWQQSSKKSTAHCWWPAKWCLISRMPAALFWNLSLKAKSAACPLVFGRELTAMGCAMMSRAEFSLRIQLSIIDKQDLFHCLDICQP